MGTNFTWFAGLDFSQVNFASSPMTWSAVYRNCFDLELRRKRPVLVLRSKIYLMLGNPNWNKGPEMPSWNTVEIRKNCAKKNVFCSVVGENIIYLHSLIGVIVLQQGDPYKLAMRWDDLLSRSLYFLACTHPISTKWWFENTNTTSLSFSSGHIVNTTYPSWNLYIIRY